MDEVGKPQALVVGGSGGIGRAICEAMAQQGWDVVLTYQKNRDAAEDVAEGLRKLGAGAEARQLDLPDGAPGNLEDISALIFAAGADITQPYISETDPADLQAAMDLEVRGFFNLVQKALPGLRKNKGSVVAVSTAGLGRFPPGDILSVAPKAAAEAIIRGVAREEGRYGVRANSVAVGVVDGGIFRRIEWKPAMLEAMKKNIPLRRFAAPGEVAEVVAFLASSRASYVTGQTLFVDGGYAV